MNHWVDSIGVIMPFQLELYSMGAMNHAFSIGAIFEHSLNSYVLFSLSDMQYLEATTERCSLKYLFFKTRETRHT